MSRSVQRRLEIQRAEQSMPSGYVPVLIPAPRRRIAILSPTPISITVRGDFCSLL